MNNLRPIKISRPKSYLLKAEWDDGFSATIKLEAFRAECPCATCKDDELKSLQGSKSMMPTFSPGKNDLKSLTPVANYAITAVWGDGHDTGIYPWQYFRSLFENNKLNDLDLADLEKDERKFNLPEFKIRSN